MPALFILPIFGLAAIALLVARATHRPSSSTQRTAKAPPDARQFELDRGLPELVVHQVLSALVEQSDPAQLDALADDLAPKYPIAASALRARAGELQEATSPRAKSDVAASARSVARRGTAARASSPDLSEAALVLQAAMKAYAEETDPVALEGFANSIREKFPTGAILLLGRARELQGVRRKTEGADPALLSTSAMAAPTAFAKPPTYVVRSGDTMALIAEREARDAARWPELTAANPAKPLASDGTFATLHPGESLHLPASWPAARAPDTTATHAEGHS